MDIYFIALTCWFSGVCLVGHWSSTDQLEPPSGFYTIRSPKTHARIELRYLPIITGISNRVLLYQHDDTWRYRVPYGPWVYPSWAELIENAQTENGEPLIEE